MLYHLNKIVYQDVKLWYTDIMGSYDNVIMLYADMTYK